jgi:hypothetical protein
MPAWKTIDGAFAALIGLAIVAVIVGNGSSAAGAISAFFTALTSLVTTILSPAQAAQATNAQGGPDSSTMTGDPSQDIPGWGANMGASGSQGNLSTSLGYQNPMMPDLPSQAFSGVSGGAGGSGGSDVGSTGDSGIQTTAAESRSHATEMDKIDKAHEWDASHPKWDSAHQRLAGERQAAWMDSHPHLAQTWIATHPREAAAFANSHPDLAKQFEKDHPKIGDALHKSAGRESAKRAARGTHDRRGKTSDRRRMRG